jgi:hypothetical protein
VTSTSPNDLTPKDGHCSATRPLPIAGRLGRDEGSDWCCPQAGKWRGLVQTTQYKRGPQGASRGDVTCTFAGHPSQQPWPNRGEVAIALGQFRCQRHRRFNRTGRLAAADATVTYCFLLVLGTQALDPLQSPRLSQPTVAKPVCAGANVDAVIAVLRRLGVVLRARRWSKRRGQSWR